MENYSRTFLNESKAVLEGLNDQIIEEMVKLFLEIRENKGRLFILGVGGSAANASHAASVFRKGLKIDAYAPSDNVAELTARTNDDGWNSVFTGWMNVVNLSASDAILIFSVGGGNMDTKVSMNIVEAIDFAQQRNAKVIGIVGKDGGYTGKKSNICLITPTINESHTGAHVLTIQLLLVQLLSTHPLFKK